tara:strand:+ start:122 stop:556 length:435 start_codon:yes stop_codon:yes gene_type:complete
MRWYELLIISFVSGYIYAYFNIGPWWLLLVFGAGFMVLTKSIWDDEEYLNIDRRHVYAIIAFLYHPVLIYLHGVYDMPVYGMSQSDMTDIFSLLGRAFGAFLVVAPLGLLTLLFKPKRKWETYWLVTMIISIIMGSLVISANSF